MRKLKLTPSLLLVLVLMLSMTIGTTYAKYATQKEVEGTINITAELGTITLQEHQAVRLSDGSYELDSSKVVTGNKYVIMPGVDIPKDPFVTVTGNGGIEAYVFVEVVSSLNDAISFEVDTSNWTKLESVTGAKGGTVYVYKDKVTQDIGPIYILKNNEVIVGQKLLSYDTSDLGIEFYAHMFQTASGADAAEVYKNNPIT